ncbi:ABC transporter substrate-binding protein [Nitratireductor soli]|uniref:ABC transporter substrate-binding protein n=1 Tax=Nitratireductor soli TaxID=1670619 RepID=UPI00065E6DC2|nr:substrate-binding domain-containing protein [Nitratireductor soli]
MKLSAFKSLMLATAIAVTATAAMADEAWRKRAGIGEFAPAAQNWEEIEAAAREEGQVVVYSVSSRIAKLVDDFRERYGVEIIGHDIPSDLQIEKLRREHKSGVYGVDVLFNSEFPMLLNEALPNELVWNFLPDSVTGDLAENEKSPLLVQRHSSRVLFYNTALNPNGAPVDSLWDLTRPEWAGRTLLPSPLEDGLSANFIQTILAHPDEMAAAYEREFGAPIEYSEAVIEAVTSNPLVDEPNASMEWLHRFLRNEPVFQGSTTKIFRNVADVKQENPPVGITSFSKMRSNEEGVYAAAPMMNLDPVFGVTYPTALMIADMAPHPNAAKLLIRYMMEKDGLEPWNEPGDYAARSSFEADQVKEFDLPPFETLKLWPIDPDEIYSSKHNFLALYLALG